MWCIIPDAMRRRPQDLPVVSTTISAVRCTFDLSYSMNGEAMRLALGLQSQFVGKGRLIAFCICRQPHFRAGKSYCTYYSWGFSIPKTCLRLLSDN